MFYCTYGYCSNNAFVICSQEVAALGGKNTDVKVGRKNAKRQKETQLLLRGKGRQGKAGFPGVQMNRTRASRSLKTEPSVKEEGEMSDNEEVYEQFKEVKWMEWCEEIMKSEEKTLKRLQKLQSISADLPKEKVYSKVASLISHV